MDRKARRAWRRSLGKIQKRLKRAKYECLEPDCNRAAIVSHSQQKEGQLRAIARNGEVYALGRNVYEAFVEAEGRTSLLLLEPAALKNASAFPGYCSGHDGSLFAPIEREALRRNDPEQAYCLFLRALSHEYARKRHGTALIRMAMAEAVIQKLAFDQELVEGLLDGLDYFLKTDAPFYLREVFRRDGMPTTEWLRWSWRVVGGCLGASCTSCFSPLQARHDSYMEEHFGEPQPLVTFSLIPTTTETHVVLCWHSQHTESVRHLEARLHSDDSLEAFLNECAFAESEDTCVNPDLWESAPEEERLQVLDAMRHEGFRGPLARVPRLIRL